MCGISGFTNLQDRHLLKKMCNSMVHRGPDSEGYYEDDHIGLGVRRLRIIDIVTGDQPIHNEDSSIWVIFNGEIYNFKELRSELETKGHSFYTRTDTEVLVHLYEEIKESMVQRLRGMFAFAIWDTTHRKLLLARDRFGKKPLYYTTRNGNLLFASELKSLLQYEEIRRVVNRKALAHYITYFYNPLDEGIIEGIYRLPPGHYLMWDANNNEPTVREYWDLPRDEENVDEEVAIEALDKLLDEAVKIRLESDVPLGALLSGGVDSSVITAIASRFMKGLKTFCVGFLGSGSEIQYARTVAETFSTDHHEYFIKPDVLKALPEVVESIGEPLADPSIIPTYYISREVKKHVTVCLTGEGGDEIFWGYPWLQDNDELEKWFMIPRVIRKPARNILAALPNATGAGMRDLKRYEDLDYSKLDKRDSCIARLSHYTPDELTKALNGNAQDTYGTYRQVMGKIRDDAKARAYITVKKVLPNDYLHKDDRLSMAHSLELRSPLLDHVLAEAIWKWPNRLKVKNGESKHLLKRYAVQKVGIPKHIIYRPKGGFSIPIQRWFKDIRDALANNTIELRGIVDDKTVQKVIRAKPSHEQANRALALLVLSLWSKLFL